MKKNIFIAFLLLATVSLIGAGCNKKTTQNQQPNNIVAEEKITPEEKDIKANQEVTQGGYINVSPKEAKRLIDENENLVVIDVSPVYDKGHLPGAVNYPVGDGSLDEVIPTLDKAKDYLVYCHADAPAIAGSQKLIDAGFLTVYRLVGNYTAWVQAGFPIEK
jgi:rhodanese-related sulfurtransferase